MTLLLAHAEKTAAILTDVFGYEESGRDGSLIRFTAPGTALGAVVDIREAGGFLAGRQGRGSVHHIAFRAADDAAQATMAKKLTGMHGMHPTEQKDRNYFRSIYFREPGGILLRSPPIAPALRWMNQMRSLGRGVEAAGLPRISSQGDRATAHTAGRRDIVSNDLSFTHRFEPGDRPDAVPLLLLHGTGGNENDLIEIGRRVAPGSALLSPRGKVLERGMPRFFRRLAEGVFDEEDVRRRAAELADFIEAARTRYGLAAPVALGFSNGANIAAAVLLLRPEALAGAVLLRAMVPLAAPPRAILAGKPVLMISGELDPIVPAANVMQLVAILEAAGADVRHRTIPASHGLSQQDIEIASEWLGWH